MDQTMHPGNGSCRSSLAYWTQALDKAKEKSLKVAKNIDVKNHRKDKQFLVHCLLYRNPNNNADIALEWATKQILNSNISHMYVGEWSCLL